MNRTVRRDARGLLIRRSHPGPVLVAPPGGSLVLPDVRSAEQARAQRCGGAGEGVHAAGLAEATGIHSAGWIRHDGGCEASLHSS